MKFKKGVIIICLLICLFSIASVNGSDVNDTVMVIDEQNDDLIEIENQNDVGAKDNTTSDVVSVEETTDKFEIVEENKDIKLNKDNSSFETSYENNDFILSEGDSILGYVDNNILGLASPHHNKYSVSVSVSNNKVYYGKDYYLILSWNSASGYVYTYDFYLKVYDSNNNEKYSERFYGDEDYSSSMHTLYLGLGPRKFDIGIYNIKILNRQDNYIMDTATLTIYSVSYSAYSVSVPDTNINYERGGTIFMYISPASGYVYYYDFYLKVYDSNNNVKHSSSRFYNTYPTSELTYYLNSNDWALGKYKIVILNNIDDYVMCTANLTIASVPYSAYSVNVSDIYAYYGTKDSIFMSISPASNYSYKYDFYLKIYDSKNILRINQRYYSFTPTDSISYTLPTSLGLGNYRISIVNTNDNHIMSATKLTIMSVPYFAYSARISDTVITYDTYWSIIMNITPANSSYYYKYNFYLKIFDSNGDEKISQNYYNYSSISQEICKSNTLLNPGIYTIKLFNNDDNYVMSVANLTVITLTSTDYSVSVSDTIIPYRDGNIIMNIIPSSAIFSKKYDFYLKVYDYNGKQKISRRYYSSDMCFQEIYSGVMLDSGDYTIKILNKYDNNVMSIANLTVSDAYSVNVLDTTINYGAGGNIIMNINPFSSYYYSYDFYLKVYDFSGNQKISYRYYSSSINSSSIETYIVDSTQLNPGNYTAFISYSRNGNYIQSDTSANIFVNKAGTIISAPDVSVDYSDEDGKLIATITNEYGKALAVYVNVILNNVNHTLKANSKGQVNVCTADLSPGNYTATISYKGNGNYYSSCVTTNVVVNKLAPIVSVSSEDIDYGEDALISVYLASDVPGNVRFTVNGVTEKAKITNGKATYTVSGLKAGTHDVIVDYAGNYKYFADSIMTTIYVYKLAPIVSVSSEDIDYGEDAVINVTLASDVPGNVRFTVNGVTGKAKITNGVATYTFSGLNYGTYAVDISYAGNYKYAADSISTTLKVNKNSVPIISVVAKNIVYGKDEVITVNLAQNVPGNVHVTVNNVTKKVKITNNTATATFSKLNKGTYDVKVTYNGNVNYNAQTKTTSFNVAKANPIIKVYPISDIIYGENQNIYVDLANDVPGNLNFNVNGVNHKVKVDSNRISLNLPYLNSNYYDVKVYYGGSANFNAQSFNTSFNVAKANPIKSVTVKDIVYGSSEAVTVNLNSNVPGNVHITVNGVTEKVKITNGVASLSVPNLNAGSYTVKVTYAGSANFNSQTKTTSFNVAKADPITSLTAYDIFTDENTEIIVKLHSKATGTVKIILNEKEYNVPISSHEAILNVDGLKDGTYSVNALYGPTSNFNSQITLTSFRVLKVYPGIDILVNLKGSDVAITGILPSDATGNAIISINGQSYSCKVVSGIASTAIPNLQSGTYDITIWYPGDEIYGNAIITRTFTFTTSQEIIYPPAPEQDSIITLIPEYDQYVSVRTGDYTISTMIWNATSINGAGIWVSANGQTVDKNLYSTRLHYYLNGEWKWSAWGQGNEGAVYHKYALDKTAIVDKVQIKF